MFLYVDLPSAKKAIIYLQVSGKTTNEYVTERNKYTWRTITDIGLFLPTEKLPETSIKSEDELENGADIEAEDIDIDVVSDKEDCDLDSSKDPLDRLGSKSPESTSSDSHSNHKDTKSAKLKMKTKGNCPDLESVHCTLETQELWEKFFDLGTEMIITKTGR